MVEDDGRRVPALTALEAAAILDELPDIVVAVDPELRVTYANAALERAAGRAAARVVGGSLEDLGFTADAVVPWRRAVARAIAKGSSEALTIDDPGRGRFEVLILPRATAARSEGALSVLRPARAAAAEPPPDALEAALGSIDDHFVMFDREWRYVYVNEAACRTLGKTRNELVGRRIWDVFPHAVGNQFWRECHAAVAEKRIMHSEHYYEPFDRWFENHFYPGAAGLSVYSTDITARKHAEAESARAQQALRETHARLDALVAASPLAIMLLDAEGKVRLWNHAAEKIFGWRADDVLGRLLPAVPEARWEEFRANLRRVLSGDPILGVETIRQDVRGEPIEVALWASAVPDGTGVLSCLSIVADISERARLERELRRRADELAEQDRRKDEFLAMLAHELRNPLAPIMTAVELLRAREGDLPTCRRARGAIERQVVQLTRLVDDLLDVSRVTRGKISLRVQRVDAAEAVARALEAVRPLFTARTQRVVVDVAPGHAVLADPVRLDQVLVNLLTNAAKYTDPGSEIRVSARAREGDVEFTVADDGVGIPPELLGRVFEMFVQEHRSLDRARGGLGIGLTLAKRLVELHGGRISAHSEGVGRGSTFSFTLPRAADGAAPHGSQAAAPPVVVAGARSILVVDDNEDAATTLRDLLASRGHSVTVAGDGPSALRLIRQLRPEIILLDIGLPGMDGYEIARLTRMLVDDYRPLLVAITGYGQPSDRARAREVGFDHHFVKPVDPAALDALVATLPSK